MKILVQPQTAYASESKLALILRHLGIDAVYAGKADYKIWVTDAIQPDESFINSRPYAINKQVVNDCFNLVFGYPIECDPETHTGHCVQKRLDHGIHGSIVRCPSKRLPGYCYQRLITNHPEDQRLEEYRLDVFGNLMLNTCKHLIKGAYGFPFAWRENRSFDFNVGTKMFTGDELAKLFRLCVLLGIEYGSLDALRDVDDRLYVIDATTNTIPSIMSWYRDVTLDEYIRVSADYFQLGLLA